MDNNVFCHQCGKKNDASSSFCFACGTKLINSNASENNKDTQNYSSNNEQPTTSNSSIDDSETKKLRKQGLIFIIFLIAIIGVIIFSCNKNKSSNTISAVEYLQNHVYTAYGNRYTFEEAIDNYSYLSNVEWEEIYNPYAEEDEFYINVSGDLTYTTVSDKIMGNSNFLNDRVTIQFCIYKPIDDDEYDIEIEDVFFVNSDDEPTFYFKNANKLYILSDIYNDNLIGIYSN